MIARSKRQRCLWLSLVSLSLLWCIVPLMVLLMVLTAIPALAGEVVIAAASDLNFAFKELLPEYEKATGNHVRLSLGSSGNFFSQIQHGAPFDLYFSADIAYPRRLVQSGLADPGTLRRYAVGRLVVWTRSDSGIDIGAGLQALAGPRVGRIALANPEHAPYGQAAVAALAREGLYDTLRARFVLGENISQAAQFAQSGNADVGLVALSLALAPAMKASGVWVEVPSSLHAPIEQGGVVLKAARNPAGARDFLAFLAGADAVRLLRANGFEAP